MLISTRGRYALRVMIDMAEHFGGGYIPMKDIAARQGISLKYLEKILPVLSKNKLIEGVHGKGGGYKLTRYPYQYKVGEILRLTEGDLSPVPCLGCNAQPCEKSSECRTIPMWEKLDSLINNYLDSVTLDDLIKQGAFYLDGL